MSKQLRPIFILIVILLVFRFNLLYGRDLFLAGTHWIGEWFAHSITHSLPVPSPAQAPHR